MKKISDLVQKFGYIIHPVLFALFPLLSFYGSNISEIRSGGFDVGVFVVFNLVAAAILWAASLIITRDRQKASLMTLVLLAIFFLFGRLHGALHDFSIATPFMLFGPTKLLLLGSLLLVIGAWLIIKRQDTAMIKKANYLFTWVGAAMILSASLPVLASYSSGGNGAHNSNQQVTEAVASDPASLPDVYYIILDAYTREDQLREKSGFDNSGFIAELKQRGFYVADKSYSNYAHTHFSVPSTFNMKYLNYLADELGEESRDRSPLKELTQNNEAITALKSLGYKYVSIGTRWPWAMDNPHADIHIEPAAAADANILNLPADEFAMVYLQTTALKPLITQTIRTDWIAKILNAFESTAKVADIEEPTFTFTHILSPHPPYLFDRNGVLNEEARLELQNEGFANRERFVEQTIYVNELVLKLVDDIVSRSDKPPIIIVASDHGSAASLNGNDFEETDPDKLDIEGIKERMGILNAYYFPDKDYSRLYPSITPVNSFRLLLSQYFGQDIELLPDKSYFSDNGANEYRMTDVTDLIN